MTSWIVRRITLLLVVLPLVAVNAVAPPRHGASEGTRLIEHLGSEKFAEREAASKRLAEIGEPALDALHKALRSDDLEIRCRARRIVAAVENRLYGPELRLTGHTGEVRSVCVSADCKRLLTSNWDKTLRLWDTATGKQLLVFQGDTARPCFGAALSPDGKRALSGSKDKTVRLWDATTGKQLLQMTGHASEVYCVAFGPEGQAMSGGYNDKTMHLWNLKTGKNTQVFRCHLSHVHQVAYSARARLAVTCSLWGPIHLWDLETGKEVRRIAVPGKGVTSVCFSPDGKRLLAMVGQLPGPFDLPQMPTGEEMLHIW